MESIQVQLPISAWWLIPALFLGLLYAYLQYKHPQRFSKPVRNVLAVFRFMIVTVLAFLLMNPLIKTVSNKTEAPSMVMLLDASTSINDYSDSLNLEKSIRALSKWKDQLENLGFKIDVQDLEGNHLSNLQEVQFSENATNLSNALQSVKTSYEGRNLAGILLLSDGLYNQGINPTYLNLNTPLYILGAGDTIPKNDLGIKKLRFNKVVYQGNQFLLQAQVEAFGFMGKTANIRLIHSGKVIAQQKVAIEKDRDLLDVDFKVDAKEKGLHRYQVEIVPIDGEFTTNNNKKQAYIEVIEGKQKIVCIAYAPHPDLKFLRSIIEENKNYEFELKYINSKTALPKSPFDLVIFHQIPNKKNLGNALIATAEKRNIPSLFMTGNTTDFNQLNKLNKALTLVGYRGQKDQVFGKYNNSFSLFNLSSDYQGIISSLPPLTVPYGEVALKGASQTVIFQQIGAVTTEKPVLAINTSAGSRSATFIGSGLFRWKLKEFAQHGEVVASSELFKKVLQLLSKKTDKRQFKFYPQKNEYWTNEQVVFQANLMNELFEPIYDLPIQLTLTHENNAVQNYEFVPGKNNNRFRVKNLQEGLYQYKATVKINGKQFINKGELLMKKQELEALQITADFDMLRHLAHTNRGGFQSIDNFNPQQWTPAQAQGRIYSEESFRPLIDLKWILLLFAILLTAEWFLRKLNGSY
ncbi:hypothetical protein [Persicobacter psychrovividus]|uniref:VWA domain-containing protein n=1 Tax=Persicobacter psychrovividus TaxID=387638 RepID=A0ABN6LA76_9BACT|nr:hypothetical protein PEPS_23800 [Persicobacter psychrovividus]